MKKGFSFIEVIVTVLIISLMAVVAATNLTRQRSKSREARRLQDTGQIMNSISLALASDVALPKTTTDREVVDITDWDGATAGTQNLKNMLVDNGYLSQLPNEPLPLSTASGESVCRSYLFVPKRSVGRLATIDAEANTDYDNRPYGIHFSAEMPGSSNGVHPLNKTVFDSPYVDLCDNQRSLGAVISPKL